jgi:hypothetical protein
MLWKQPVLRKIATLAFYLLSKDIIWKYILSQPVSKNGYEFFPKRKKKKKENLNK